MKIKNAFVFLILVQALCEEARAGEHYRKPPVFSRMDAQQDIIIKGRVSDASGNPLNGVSVAVKGSKAATSTNESGNFLLAVPNANATLEFSFVGFNTEVYSLEGKTNVNITLNVLASSMGEVVVVGYGTQKKSVVTGAISSVKAADLENQQIGRVEQALQGRTSGLTIASSSGSPGSASTVRVRGTTSLNGAASNPLYVVDGVVVEIGGIDYLNPSDIESIEVLKDAASAAIYGARSSAGVILVTTKKGKAGSIRVNYNAYYGTQAPAKKLELLNATQYAQLSNEQSVNGGGANIFANPSALGEGTDWQDLIFNNNARIQNHEVSISGGSEKSTFYTSFGLFDQEGIVGTAISGFKRYNIRLNSTHKIKSWLTFGQNVGYSHIKSTGGFGGNSDFGGPLSSAINLDPITPVVVTDPAVINSVPYSTQPVIRDQQGNPYGVSPYVQQQMTNPVAYIQTRLGNYEWNDNIVGNAYVEAEPVKGLKLRSTVGAKLGFWGSESFTPVFFLNSNVQSTQTAFVRDRQQIFNWNLENTLAYSRLFNAHQVTVLLGQGAYLDNNSSGLNVAYYNLPVTTFEDASMNYGTSAANKNATGYEGIQHKVSSLFGRLTYNFNEKYLFTGIIRRDGSSRFGSNNKFGYFPSASVGWVTTKEGFWPANHVVNFLKFRGSYGITGNDVLGDFRYLSTVSSGRNYPFGTTYNIGYSPDAPSNPDLKWEETSQLNIGLDATIFRNWSLSFDWYKKTTTGILQKVVFPSYVGATGSSFGNVADMDNKGMELELGYHKQLGKVRFDLKGNVSYLQNEVTYLGEGKRFIEGEARVQNAAYTITRTAVGHAIGSFYGFQTAGIFQNQADVTNYKNKSGLPIQPTARPGDFRWSDINEDGLIDANDRAFTGDPTPNWSYGFSFNASWNGIDLLLFGQGIAGNQIYQALRRLDIPTANWQTETLARWTGEGTSNAYPRLTTNDANKNFSNPSNFHLENGDYFRVKTLQVGYTFTQDFITRIGLQKARIYLSSNNLLTITRYTGFDPEIGGSSYGIDRAIYPQSRSLIAGLNLNF
ncbi:MAG: TonB-dependent receptor [Chitinophagaceae bacterium]